MSRLISFITDKDFVGLAQEIGLLALGVASLTNNPSLKMSGTCTLTGLESRVNALLTHFDSSREVGRIWDFDKHFDRPDNVILDMVPIITKTINYRLPKRDTSFNWLLTECKRISYSVNMLSNQDSLRFIDGDTDYTDEFIRSIILRLYNLRHLISLIRLELERSDKILLSGTAANALYVVHLAMMESSAQKIITALYLVEALLNVNVEPYTGGEITRAEVTNLPILLIVTAYMNNGLLDESLVKECLGKCYTVIQNETGTRFKNFVETVRDDVS